MNKEHIANTWLNEGLPAWRRAGAKINFLKKDNLNIPVIYARELGQVKRVRTILLLAGIHMEEISGIKYLLDPKNLESYRKNGNNLIIFPVVNQYGLNFLNDADEKLLRYDHKGINYNGGWGNYKFENKTKESCLIETEIKKYLINQNIDISISYHEDSDLPQKGYIFTKGVNTQRRKIMADRIKASTDNKLLAVLTHDTELFGGQIEHNFVIANDNDVDAFDNWIYDSLKIPSVLIEGPFGCDLETRLKFLVNVTESVLTA